MFEMCLKSERVLPREKGQFAWIGTRRDYPDWIEATEKLLLQNPLFESRPSLRTLELPKKMRTISPPAVFMGIGLANRTQLSNGLPLDLLGMLLPAEQLRQTIAAEILIVLVADEHAHSNGFAAEDINFRARETLAQLKQIKHRLGLSKMKVIRASELHQIQDYQNTLVEVESRSPAQAHPYFKQEVADISFFQRCYGGLVKVGWTISGSTDLLRKYDEIAFDQRYRAWQGREQASIAFVYCKAGRKLDDQQPKASPYITSDPQKRILLHPEENVRHKLAQAKRHASAATIRGVRKHLTAMTRVFHELYQPLTGPLEKKTQDLIAWTSQPS